MFVSTHKHNSLHHEIRLALDLVSLRPVAYSIEGMVLEYGLRVLVHQDELTTFTHSWLELDVRIIPRGGMSLGDLLQEVGLREVGFGGPKPVMAFLTYFQRQVYVPVGRDRDGTLTDRKCFELLLVIEVYTSLDFDDMHQRDITIIYCLDDAFLHDLLSLSLAILFVVHLKRNLAKGPRTIDSSSILSTITNVVVDQYSSKARELTETFDMREPNTLGEPKLILEV